MGTDSSPLDVTVRGPGEPEIVVVGGVHGDETGGIRAVRRLREAALDLQRTVAFVLANPAAIDANVRSLDSDLNRVFPGDPAGDREERLAAHLCEFIRGRPTLSLHDTRSRPTPFALVYRTQPGEFDLAATLPVPYIVDHWGVNEQTITTCGLTVELEVGPQGSDEAAASAEHQTRAFLRGMGALPGEPATANPEFFHMAAPIPKPPGSSYDVSVENFEYVPEGTVYASVDGRDLVADEPFYPILLSASGYPDLFGYRGDRIAGSLPELKEWLAGEDQVWEDVDSRAHR